MTSICKRILLVLASSVVMVASAQTMVVSVLGGSAQPLGGYVALTEMRESGLTADLTFGVVSVASAPWQAMMHASLSRSAAAGLLGAATVQAEGALRTDGNGTVELSGQGVLGPASVRLGVAFASLPPPAFSFSGVAPLATSPRVAGPAVSVDALVRYRIDRNLLAGVEPVIVFAPDGVAWRMHASLRLRDLVPPFDGSFEVHAYSAPGGSAWSGAVGTGGIWAPRRAPEWRATLWLGAANGSLRPGIALRGATSLGHGLSLSVDVAAETFRLDVPPYRGALALELDLGSQEAFVRTEGEFGDAPAAALVAGLRVALESP